MKDYDIVIAVKENGYFVGCVSSINIKNDKSGYALSNYKISENPKKALRFKFSFSAEQFLVYLCANNNPQQNGNDEVRIEFTLRKYGYMLEAYKSSKKIEQIRKKEAETAENSDISSKSLNK